MGAVLACCAFAPTRTSPLGRCLPSCNAMAQCPEPRLVRLLPCRSQTKCMLCLHAALEPPPAHPPLTAACLPAMPRLNVQDCACRCAGHGPSVRGAAGGWAGGRAAAPGADRGGPVGVGLLHQAAAAGAHAAGPLHTGGAPARFGYVHPRAAAGCLVPRLPLWAGRALVSLLRGCLALHALLVG